MERKTIKQFLIVSALACFGFVLAMGTAQAQEGETTVQGTQNSAGSLANTGTAVGANQSNFNAGPNATSGAAASSQQLGSNSGAVSQAAEAKSGDPVAGGQVTGCVCDNATVQNSNNSVGSLAHSGPAIAVNSETGNVGPTASATGPASTAQSGNNTKDVAQSTATETGDAVAGSQVTGIVGSGVHTVQNQNFGTLGFAFSGSTLGVNFSTGAVGPAAVSATVAQTSQLGDNDATLSQASEVVTGDALAGAQVSGIVGGSATVQNTNTAPINVAKSGFGLGLNIAVPAQVGPAAAAPVVAQASQTGDNSADVAQVVTGETGDAVSGSQVTGAVGDQGGFLVVQNQQASTGDVAFAGSLVATNIGATHAGPVSASIGVASTAQNGDNDVVFAQAIEAETGDALAGSQVTGGVGHTDVTVMNSNAAAANLAVSGIAVTANVGIGAAGPVAAAAGVATTSQLGDNELALDQAISAETGDAVAGGQITGVVATAGADVTIANSNTAVGNFAFSGFVVATNVDVAVAGPFSFALLVAQTSQTGDNSAAVSQAIEAETGDAVGGAQVTGVVAGAGSDVTVMNQQFAALNFGVSGFVLAFNADIVTSVGPRSIAPIGVATVSQMGDNSLAAAQSLEASSGDAVTGSQITGVVAGAGSSATIANSNTAIANLSFSGPVIAVNLLGQILPLSVGPNATAGLFATASQTGDNSLAFAQDLVGESGDAVSGSQVSGIVGTRDATVQVQQNAFASFGFSGFVGALNAASGTLTATAATPPTGIAASASQNGDTAFAGAQELTSETGDGLGGAQITGEVGDLAGAGAGL